MSRQSMALIGKAGPPLFGVLMLFAKNEPSSEDGGCDEQRREAHGEPRVAAAVGAAFRAVAGSG